MLLSPGSLPGVGGFIGLHALLWTVLEWSWQIGEPCSVPINKGGWNFILSVFSCVCLLNKFWLTNWSTAEWSVFTYVYMPYFYIMIHRHRWRGFLCRVHSLSLPKKHWVTHYSLMGTPTESHNINAGRKIVKMDRFGASEQMSNKSPFYT